MLKRKPKEEISPTELGQAAHPVAKPADAPETALLDETGLYQRWYFERRLREETARAGRSGVPFSLATWQLRTFQAEPGNPDLWGRAASAILENLRWYDVAARIDARHFAAIVFDADHDRAAAIAYRTKCELQVRLPSHGKWQVGVATFGRDGQDADALMQAALRSLEQDLRAA